MSYSKRFDEALSFANKLHREQTRKGKDVPYINHLMGVASLVGSNGGDEDQVIGALLHDAIEDCIDAVPDIREQIRDKFGERVLEIVEGCTDADRHPKPPWPERKQAYMAHLRELPDDSPVLLVSLGDKLHNARSILRDLREVGDDLWTRFKGRHGGTLWYYNTLAEIFEEKQPGHLADELRRVVEQMKAEGGVPAILETADTDNALLVSLLEERLDEGLSILDALDFLVVESAKWWDFLAEIDPTDLTVQAWVRVEPDESLGDEAFGTDEGAEFEQQALEALQQAYGPWEEAGFSPAAEPQLQSVERGPIDSHTISMTQLLTRPCHSLDEVVEVLEWVEERGATIKLSATA